MYLKKALSHTTILCGAFTLFSLPPAAHANPQGGSVVGGDAVISQSGNTLTIQQNSDRAIIDWSSFDITQSELTRFQQPSSTSIALNRIRDSKPSQIDGQISANGTVILVNPKGVVFGEHSQVNVNSVVATSSDVDNSAFMQGGSLVFNQPGSAQAQIITRGQITVADAGLVGLVAPHVENQGIITARLGKVQLASGDGFTLDMAGDGISGVTVTDDVMAQLVRNGGLIEADGGRIELTAASARTAVDALIVNTGRLKADTFVQQEGMIRLYAAKGTVSNSGIIEAKGAAGQNGGNIAIAAKHVTQQGTLDVSGDTAGNIDIQADTIEMDGLTSAQGLTRGGAINIDFDTLYRSAASSILTVASAGGAGGNIRIEGGSNASLYASGDYIADGQTQGGNIDLLAGRDVILLGGFLSGRGQTGGGNVRIGGDYQGGNGVRRARRTLVDGNTRINVDALDSGNGGRVIVWADEITGFYGDISARGGAGGGDGGFIETSGKLHLDAQGTVDTRAPHGTTGTWLLDPTNITISSAGSTGSMAWDGTNFADTSTTPSVLNVSTLTTQLASSNVIVTTASGLGGAGNITVSNAISWNSSYSLTLLANGSITLNAGITNSGSGALTLSAGTNITDNGQGITLTGGALTVRARNADGATGYVVLWSTITTNGGNVTIGGGSGAITAGSGYAIGTSSNGAQVGVSVAAINAGGGTVILNGQGSSYASGSNIGVRVSGSVRTSSTGAITINGTGGSAGNNNYGIYNVYSDSDGSDFGSITSSGSGAITLNGTAGSGSSNYGLYLAAQGGNFSVPSITRVGYNGTNVYTGAISISATGAGLYTAYTSSVNYSSVVIQTSNAAISFAGTTNISGTIASTITTTNNGISFSNSTGNIYVGNVTTSNSVISLTSVGSITTGGLTTTGGAVTLTNGSGNITTSGIGTTNGAITLTNNYGNISTNYLTTSTTGGYAITLSAAGNITSVNGITGSSVLLRARNADAATGYVYTGNITTGGGDVIIGGGSGTISAGSGYAIGTATVNQQLGASVGAITAAGGTIIINGQGGTYSSGGNIGVRLGGNATTSGTATITINGTGGTGGNDNYGISNIYTDSDGSDIGSITSSGSGAITLNGVSNNGSNNYGIYLVVQQSSLGTQTTRIGYNGTNVYTGAISISAGGAGLYGYFVGNVLYAGSSSNINIQNSNAAIDFTGTTNISGTEAINITTTNNAITVNGTTGNMVVGNISNSSGAITLTSTGNISTGGLSTSSAGITVTSTGGYIATGGNITTSSSGSAAVALTATTYISTSNITGSSVLVNSDSDGDADGTSTAAKLGYIYINGTVTTNGGNITLGGGATPATGKARGSSTQATRFGVLVGLITAAGGNITVNGQGGAYSSGGNYGVFFAGSGTSSTSGTGTITISGTGGSASNNNYGVTNINTYTNDWGGTNTDYIAISSTGSGAISITGVAGSGTGNYGIYAGSTIGGASASGNITLIANTISLASNTVVRTTGDITIKPYTSGTTVGVGTGSGTLGITGTYLGYLNWGSSNSLIIGDTTNTGAMEINYTTTLTKKVQFITKSGSDITLSGNITSSVAGDAVVIAAGGNFMNTTNKTITLNNAGSKRWIIYSTSAGSDSPGGLSNANASGPYNGYTYNTLAPGSVGGSGNTWVYSSGGGTITFTADSLSRYYGASNPSLTYAFSCSTGCSYADAVSGGSISLTTAANGTSAVGGYTITAAQGTLAFNGGYSGYTINYVNGTLTVNAAPLTITATANSKTYGDVLTLDGSTGFTPSGLANSETIGSVTLTANGGLLAAANAGSYTITPSAATGGTFTASNYSITYVAGTLTVNKKALTVIAANTSRSYGSSTVSTTTSYTGFVNSEDATSAGITGTAGFTTDATTTSNVGGTYYIRPSAGSLTSTNYSFGSFTDGVLSITQAALTITASNVSGTYGAVSLNGSSGFSTSGLQNSETVGSVTLTTNATLSSGGYYNYNATPWTITPSAATGGTFNASNYSITYANATTGLTVSRAALTITGVTAGNKTYDGTTAATISTGSAALSGVLGSDAVSLSSAGATGTFATAGAGTGKTVNTSGFSISNTDANNYSLTQPTTTADIAGRALTITASAKSKTYGDALTLDGTADFTSSGLQNGETIGSVTLSANGGLLAAANAGSYTITPSAATGGTFDAASYTITYATGALTVNAKSITIAADNQTREYGLANPTLTYSCGTLVGGDTCGTGAGGIFSAAPTLSTLAGLTSSVTGGPYAINASGGTLNTSNYTIAGYTGGLLTVTTAALTVTADDLSRYYGSNNPTLTYSVSGLRNSDTAGSVLTGLGVTTAATSSSNANTYTLTMAGSLTSSNYSLTLQNGTLTVNPALLTVTPGNKSRTYGSNNPAFDGTITGFVLGDTEGAIVTGAPTYASAATSSSNAGTYDITASGGTLSSSNYAFSYGTGTLTVNKATLTVTADNKSKTYAQVNPAFTGAITGFVLGQDDSVIDTMPTYGTAASQYTNAGTYAITPSGALDNNYSFSYVNGTLTIGAASLTITADNKSKTYGAANPAYTYQITSGALATGDTLDSVTLGSSATTASGVGTYAITPSAASGTGISNYTIAYVPGTLTVNAAPLTVTPNNLSKTYGASDPTLTYSYSGLVGSDTASVFSGALSRAAGSNAGSYAITIGTLTTSNYTISLTAGRTLTINPASLTITATNQSKGYGSTLNFAGTEFTANGLVGGETVGSVTLSSSGAASGANAGTYAITPSAATGGTFSASNYTITYSTSGTLTVTPGTLTISPNSYTITYGDAAPSYNGSYTGEMGGDTFTISYAASGYANNVGTYTIIGTPSGSNLSNYTVVNNAATLTVNKAALTVAANNVTRAYGTANSFTSSYTGWKFSDTASVLSGAAAYTTAATQGSDIGTYAFTPSIGTLSAANYSFTGFTPATLTIAKADLIVTPDNLSKVYGNANPTLTGTLIGLYTPDNISTSYSTAAGLQSGVGSYAITASAVSDPLNRLGNYNLSYQTGALVITPATLIATADDKTKAFGEANPMLTLTLTSLKSWDDESAFSGYTLSTLAGTMSMGYYTINLSGGTSTNYNVTRYAGRLTIDGPTIPQNITNVEPAGPSIVTHATNDNTPLIDSGSYTASPAIYLPGDCTSDSQSSSKCRKSVKGNNIAPQRQSEL